MAEAPLIRSAQAEEDLIAIWTHIAQFDPAAADRVLDKIEQRFRLLAARPRSGSLQSELGPGLRQVVIGNYLAFYSIRTEAVHVLRVIHGKRNIGPDDVSD